jgi:hypothetical protein
MSYDGIYSIVNNKRWKDDNYKPTYLNDNAGENNYCAKLTHEKVEQIRKRRANGEKVIDLANEFGVNSSTISGIVHFRWWRGEL